MFKLGIDVSQKRFDCTLIDKTGQRHYKSFKNNEKGFTRLKKWLTKHQAQAVHACLEATNIYWEELAEYLHSQGYQVSVVNPLRIKGFAQSQLRRNKTDKIDSEVIATFCAQTEPQRWSPPKAHQRQLRALVRHQQALQKSLTQYQNRLKVTREPLVRASLQTLIEALQSQSEQIASQIETLIAQQPDLQQQMTLLCSIKGIGPKTATVLMAEMYDLADYESARAAAADAGLTPAHYRSGTSVRKRTKLSKMGKGAVRGILYFPTLTAIRHNPIIRAFADRLRARGKSKQVIRGAAMRKLLHIAYGVLKHQRPFDPNYVN